MSTKTVRVLLVEDNPGDVALVRAGLEETEVTCDLSIISDGQQALDFFLEEERVLPDLVLLDINLPKVNGFEILKNIRRQKATATLPVIMLTSSETEIDLMQSYEHKANSHMTKPVDVDDFIQKIKSLERYWLPAANLRSNSNH